MYVDQMSQLRMEAIRAGVQFARGTDMKGVIALADHFMEYALRQPGEVDEAPKPRRKRTTDIPSHEIYVDRYGRQWVKLDSGNVTLLHDRLRGHMEMGYNFDLMEKAHELKLVSMPYDY